MKAGATDYLLPKQKTQLPEAIKQAIRLEKLSVESLQQQKIDSDLGTNREEQLLKQTTELIESNRQLQQEIARKSQTEAALLQTQAQLQNLIANNVDGMVVVNQQGIIRFLNPAGTILFGRQEEELLGQLFGFPLINGNDVEVDVCNRAGEIVIAQMRVAQIQWQGEPAYLVSLRDITVRKHAENERLKQLLEEAQTANRLKNEFLAIVSHELRTPLNPILGWAKILRSRKLDQSVIQKALETIERNASLQAQLIDDLLDISRILRGKIRLQPVVVDLKTIITAAIDTVGLAAQAKSIEINTVFDTNIESCLGDPNRLQQVIWNLLTNSIKFTQNHGQVTIKLERVEGYAQIQVSDTGKGINCNFLPYIFDYFCQENSSTTRSTGGLGLGLAIVRRLVELHGGTIEAESAGEGQGATFTIRLPLIPTLAKTQNSRQDNNNLDLNGVRVLVVDDQADNLNIIIYILEEHGASVYSATSVPDAFSSLVAHPPDIVVSDIGMPEEDGYELIRQIRSLPAKQGGQIPAIAITAYASEYDRQRALEMGFQTHIPKPVEPDNLLHAIYNLVNLYN
ncbi:hypothetical protein CAL7716_042190 [Calothrix sp. PCC 7716]|nr:hypothetical protein CAL7716_042190 [Calothrix sp. PCC 7716]